MSDLVEFLLARIAEDEAAARAAGGEAWVAQEDWYEEYDWSVGARWSDETGREGVGRDVVTDKDTAAHVVRWMPARVLAECDAKRRIVERCSAADTMLGDEVMRLLARPYVDHEAYREEWRP